MEARLADIFREPTVEKKLAGSRPHSYSSNAPGYLRENLLERGAPGSNSCRAVTSSVSALPSEQARLRALQGLPVVEITALWGRLLESLNQGVVILGRDLTPLYWNHQASDLCYVGGREPNNLPKLSIAIADIGNYCIRSGEGSHKTVMMECEISNHHIVRLRARWLNATGLFEAQKATVETASAQSQDYILVTLEDCYETLRQELHFDQKKYDLTERETEVWMLLRQEYSYQEIAKLLQISLNTVKTHVKNVYAKRRSHLSNSNFWCHVNSSALA